MQKFDDTQAFMALTDSEKWEIMIAEMRGLKKEVEESKGIIEANTEATTSLMEFLQAMKGVVYFGNMLGKAGKFIGWLIFIGSVCWGALYAMFHHGEWPKL